MHFITRNERDRGCDITSQESGLELYVPPCVTRAVAFLPREPAMLAQYWDRNSVCVSLRLSVRLSVCHMPAL